MAILPAMHAGTIVARNYLAQARVLARTFFEQHPDGSFTVLLLDPNGTEDPAAEPFDLVGPDEVIGADNYGVLKSYYSVLELATAVKPALLSYILDRHDHAVYLDPDLWIRKPLSEVPGLAVQHGIVLTPHLLEPLPLDHMSASEEYIMRSGIYNLGFIAVGEKARPFLSWWWERLQRHCLVAIDRGLFTDQRWVDWAPSMHDFYILKDPALNVAYWNLSNRTVTKEGDEYYVKGEPVRFFHFSGYSPDRPHVLSKHLGDNPRVLLSQEPGLKAACDAYGQMLIDEGFLEAVTEPYGGDTLPNGVPLDKWMRAAYRAALLESEDPLEDAEPPPNPFTETDEFMEWLRTRDDVTLPGWMSRYLSQIYNGRQDVATAFANIRGADGPRYLDWVRTSGRTEESIPDEMVPGDVDELTRFAVDPVGTGVNLVGYLNAELGVGEAARSLLEAIEAGESPTATVTYEANLSRRRHPFVERRPHPEISNPYDANVLCVNADSTAGLLATLGPDFRANRYNVGYWAWELEEFPEAWLGASHHLDEIWMNSEFAAGGLRELTGKPVKSMPVPVNRPEFDPIDRSALGIPDGFFFLFVFDFLSVLDRKNPLGLVEAFTRAFADGEGPAHPAEPRSRGREPPAARPHTRTRRARAPGSRPGRPPACRRRVRPRPRVG